jgi:hypothetical protein
MSGAVSTSTTFPPVRAGSVYSLTQSTCVASRDGAQVSVPHCREAGNEPTTTLGAAPGRVVGRDLFVRPIAKSGQLPRRSHAGTGQTPAIGALACRPQRTQLSGNSHLLNTHRYQLTSASYVV